MNITYPMKMIFGILFSYMSFEPCDTHVWLVTLPMTSAPCSQQQIGLYQRHVVILVMFKTLQNIRKCSWNHQAKQLNGKTKAKVLWKLHSKNDIRKYMVKAFLYSNAVICLGFERSVSHFPKDVPTGLFWKLTCPWKNNCKTSVLLSTNQSVPLKHTVSVKKNLAAFRAQIFLCS